MKKTQTVLDEGETPMIATSCSLNSISKFWCKMMHDPRHWRLTLIYKAMFNVIFLFLFLQKYRWMYGFWGSIHAWKNLCQCIYAIYAYSIYIYLLQIGLKFDCQSTSCCFSVQGTELFVCFFPPSTLKESYWRFDTVGLRRWQDMNPRSSSTFLETFFLHFSLCSSFSYLL